MKISRKKEFKKVKVSYNKKLFWTIVALFVLLIGLIIVINLKQVEEIEYQIIGGDRDEHGCLGSAGYSWNQTKQKCVREWEEKNKYYCTQEDRISDMCTFLYDPVCANAYEIGDIKPETKSNGCVACQDENVKYYINGGCE